MRILVEIGWLHPKLCTKYFSAHTDRPKLIFYENHRNLHRCFPSNQLWSSSIYSSIHRLDNISHFVHSHYPQTYIIRGFQYPSRKKIHIENPLFHPKKVNFPTFPSFFALGALVEPLSLSLPSLVCSFSCAQSMNFALQRVRLLQVRSYHNNFFARNLYMRCTSCI